MIARWRAIMSQILVCNLDETVVGRTHIRFYHEYYFVPTHKLTAIARKAQPLSVYKRILKVE
jgi:hypothetical protein